MGAKVIGRVVDAAILLVGLAAVLAVFRGAAALLGGKAGETVWAVTTGSPVSRALSGEAAVSWTHGTLALQAQPLLFWISLLLQLFTLALVAKALLALRAVLSRFAAGDMLVSANADGLRAIALALFAVCGLSILGTLVTQSLVLAAVAPPPGVVLHPSLSWSVPGAENLWLDYEVPVGTALLGGLAWLFGQALSAGTAFREDSEGVL